MRPGPIMAAEDNFEITLTGKGAHAAMPHMGIDPIVMGSEAVLALQTVVSRRLPPADAAVISVTDFDVDATRNVIPERITLRGDTRAFTPEIQAVIEQGMEDVVAGICRSHSGRYDFTYSHEFAATINTAAECGHAAEAARALVGEDMVDAACAPIMASEDFGFMLQRKPGCYLFLGNGGDGPGGCGLHSPNYDFNDDILTTGAAFWQQLVRMQLPES